MTDKRLAFTKMQSLGNDFVMIDGVRKHIRLSRNIASRISDRHYGIGCDQIIMAERGRGSDEFLMRVFNADGSEVGQCGNGARCFAVFLKDQGLCRNGRVKVETITTRLELEINEDESVSASMGVPEFRPSKIPLLADREQLQYTVSIDHREIGFSAVSVGNPHCVLFVPNCATADVAGLGPTLENHPIFPERTNVGFAQTVSRKEINLRVFERGVGETQGCGSGACAAVATGVRTGILDREVVVNLPGGRAVVDWMSEEAPIRLTGGVETVFHGEFKLDDVP
ncbi:MAG: diaminopimelate epimerase [Gammaproteobacteria bacterium]|nr:diaminopimelate epimerase [Gammaproteobacteria bacterium]